MGMTDDAITTDAGSGDGSSAGSVAADAHRVGGNHRLGPGGGGVVMQIPPSIVRAICAVQATVESVRKSGKNAHGGYAFASTDDIYAAITRKLGEVGLVAIAVEQCAEIKRFEKDGKTQQWLHAKFGFVLATDEATWEHPHLRRTLYIQVNGPQTFQAAQSYAEKSFLRSLFKLPTGDLDLDSMPQADNEEDQIALLSNGRNRKSSAEGKRDGSVKRFNSMRADVAAALNAEHLKHIRTAFAEEWSTLPPRWAEVLDDEYETRMASFGAVQAAE